MEAGPAVEAETGPWYKLSEADMQAFAEYTGAIDKGGKWGHRLNIFFEDGRSRYAIFTQEEWDFLNVTMGRKRMMDNHGRMYSQEDIADIKQTIKEALHG